MCPSTVNYLGPAHHQPGTEFYVVPPTRAGGHHSGLVELLRSLPSRAPRDASGSGATEPSTRASELETDAIDAPSQQPRRTLLNLKLLVPLTTIALFALPTATARADGTWR